MNSSGLTKENLLRSLPVSLFGDPKMTALAEAVAGVLAKRLEEIGRTSVYPHIDRLDEGLLDILARDFKVDWWDSDYTLDEKRRTLMTSWQVHKALGTKGAVEKAASAVYPEARAQEWFEYGGEPYSFRLDVDLQEGEWEPDRHRRLMERMQYYKNLRSHMEAVNYHIPPAVLENKVRFLFVSQLIRVRASSLGEESIRLDGRRNLDGSWQLSQRFTRGATFYRLLVSIETENLFRQTLQQTMRANIRAPTTARLTGLKVLRYSAANLGKEEILLNGRRPLDGGYELSVSFSKGVSLRGFTCRYRVENPQGSESFLTTKVDNRLDSSFTLSGARKLNAGTSRREL